MEEDFKGLLQFMYFVSGPSWRGRHGGESDHSSRDVKQTVTVCPQSRSREMKAGAYLSLSRTPGCRMAPSTVRGTRPSVTSVSAVTEMLRAGPVSSLTGHGFQLGTL